MKIYIKKILEFVSVSRFGTHTKGAKNFNPIIFVMEFAHDISHITRFLN